MTPELMMFNMRNVIKELIDVSPHGTAPHQLGCDECRACKLGLETIRAYDRMIEDEKPVVVSTTRTG